MNLTKEQIAQFDKDGYLFFPNLFSKEEVQNLSAEVPKLYDIREEYNYLNYNLYNLSLQHSNIVLLDMQIKFFLS